MLLTSLKQYLSKSVRGAEPQEAIPQYTNEWVSSSVYLFFCMRQCMPATQSLWCGYGQVAVVSMAPHIHIHKNKGTWWMLKTVTGYTLRRKRDKCKLHMPQINIMLTTVIVEKLLKQKHTNKHKHTHKHMLNRIDIWRELAYLWRCDHGKLCISVSDCISTRSLT